MVLTWICWQKLVKQYNGQRPTNYTIANKREWLSFSFLMKVWLFFFAVSTDVYREILLKHHTLMLVITSWMLFYSSDSIEKKKHILYLLLYEYHFYKDAIEGIHNNDLKYYVWMMKIMFSRVINWKINNEYNKCFYFFVAQKYTQLAISLYNYLSSFSKYNVILSKVTFFLPTMQHK
jgi:hypothetical protein